MRQQRAGLCSKTLTGVAVLHVGLGPARTGPLNWSSACWQRVLWSRPLGLQSAAAEES